MRLLLGLWVKLCRRKTINLYLVNLRGFCEILDRDSTFSWKSLSRQFRGRNVGFVCGRVLRSSEYGVHAIGGFINHQKYCVHVGVICVLVRILTMCNLYYNPAPFLIRSLET